MNLSPKLFTTNDEDGQSNRLTMRITVGGNVDRTITTANNMFLFDSAYARKAENAGHRFSSKAID